VPSRSGLNSKTRERADCFTTCPREPKDGLSIYAACGQAPGSYCEKAECRKQTARPCRLRPGTPLTTGPDARHVHVQHFSGFWLHPMETPNASMTWLIRARAGLHAAVGPMMIYMRRSASGIPVENETRPSMAVHRFRGARCWHGDFEYAYKFIF
jgi:hypothetical protein